MDTDKTAAALKSSATSLSYDRIAIVLCTTGLCLLALHYLKFTTVFIAFLNMLDTLRGDSVSSTRLLLEQSGFFELLAYSWWGFWHLVAYAIVPMIVIKTLLHDAIMDYGLRATGLSQHSGLYLLLCLPIIVFAIAASFRTDFSSHYPFYRFAARSWFDLLCWELIYLLQFACLEFFFRGFLLFGCRPIFGHHAIWVMMLPYLMIYFSKPWLEASGALVFGVLLGALALRSRSIWGGVLVHITIALTMDCAALLQGQGLPQQLYPQ